MNKVKMVCSDIDGTLLDANRELSSETVKALTKIKDFMPVVLISSRMPNAMRHLQAEVDIDHHPLIAYNGGLVIDQKGPMPVRLLSVEIDITYVRKVLDYSDGTDIHVSLYHDDEWYVPQDDYWAQREQNNTKVQAVVMDGTSVCEKWSTEGKGAHKIMCMGDATAIQGLYDRLYATYGEELHLYRSKDSYLEIASKKISKLSGLAHLLKDGEVTLDEVMAFGDNYNDVEMIAGVGYGVAVSNARTEVKNVAKRISGPAKENGVAAVISELIEYVQKD